MAYCTPAEVRQYLGIDGLGDDALLSNLIGRAQVRIENRTHRVFESTADTTRNFTVGVDTDDRMLWFDEDCASITTVTSNADGTSSTAVSSTEYTTHPRNRTPYYGISIKSSVSKTWTYQDDPEEGVTVAGRWAYSTSPPADVKDRCIKLSALYYRMKDSVDGVIGIPEAGGVTVQDAEESLLADLDHYKKGLHGV